MALVPNMLSLWNKAIIITIIIIIIIIIMQSFGLDLININVYAK